jgi:hypothetical protein
MPGKEQETGFRRIENEPEFSTGEGGVQGLYQQVMGENKTEKKRS